MLAQVGEGGCRLLSQPAPPLYPPEHEGLIVLLFYLNLKLPPPVPCITEKMLNSYSQVMFHFWTFADKEASCWWSIDLIDWLNIIFVSARRLSSNSVDIWCTFLMASRYSSILLLLVQVGKSKTVQFFLVRFTLCYTLSMYVLFISAF